MSEQSYLMELAPKDRILALEDTADSTEITSYVKPLTPEELDVKREQLSECAIKLQELKEELKAVKADNKAKATPINEQLSLLINEVKTKQQMCEGKVYHLANHDSGMMETFDENGEFIGSRRLRPDERQANLFVTAQNQ